MEISDDASDVKLEDSKIWIPGQDGHEYSHEQWITALACTLIESDLVKDEVLVVLSPICKAKVIVKNCEQQTSYFYLACLLKGSEPLRIVAPLKRTCLISRFFLSGKKVYDIATPFVSPSHFKSVV